MARSSSQPWRGCCRGRGCLPPWIVRRTPVSLDQIAARDNLVLATWNAARGKRTRADVQAFLADPDGSLGRLSTGILAGTVPKGAFREFTIHDPKLRRIHAACFEDRVLHYAILNRVEAVFERTLADSSFACRPGRGSHAVVRQVQACLRRQPRLRVANWCAHVPALCQFLSGWRRPASAGPPLGAGSARRSVAAWAGVQIDALRLQQGYAAVLAPTLPADAAGKTCSSTPPVRRLGRVIVMGVSRVLRRVSWNNNGRNCRAANRNNNLGFRLAPA